MNEKLYVRRSQQHTVCFGNENREALYRRADFLGEFFKEKSPELSVPCFLIAGLSANNMQKVLKAMLSMAAALTNLKKI